MTDKNMPTSASTVDVLAKFELSYVSDRGQPFSLQVDLSLPGQGITAVFGESGSGKTSLLRCIAGLEDTYTGRLEVGGKVWQDADTFLPTHKRSLGYVFQEPSLFEHLTVMDNLAYAIKRVGQTVNPPLLEQVVDVMAIEDLLTQLPAKLSGGEKQRVAIARALLSQPKILLMDEPLASLDSSRKLEILPYLESLRGKLEIPIIYVTHSLDEVVRLADHMLMMKGGRCIAQGDVSGLLSRVDLFLGADQEMSAVLECQVSEIDERWHLMKVTFNHGDLWLPHARHKPLERIRVRVLASDVSLALTSNSNSSILNRIQGTVVDIIEDAEPAMTLVKVKVGASILVARITHKSAHILDLTIDKPVCVQVKSAAIVR